MSEVNPSPQPHQPPDTSIGELAWCSILYGAVLGTLFGVGVLNRLPSMFESYLDAITTCWIIAVAIPSALQLPIGIYVLQRQRSAAIACYRTTLGLVALSVIYLPVCFLTDWRFLVVVAFPLGWGLYAQSLMKSSKEMQKLLE